MDVLKSKKKLQFQTNKRLAHGVITTDFAVKGACDWSRPDGTTPDL